jgi:hypothetical protein
MSSFPVKKQRFSVMSTLGAKKPDIRFLDKIGDPVT